MSFRLVERDRARTRINLVNTISLLASLVVVCSVIPAAIFWFASSDVELVQKSILAGSAVAAIVFGVVFGRALSPPKRPLKFRRGHRLN